MSVVLATKSVMFYYDIPSRLIQMGLAQQVEAGGAW